MCSHSSRFSGGAANAGVDFPHRVTAAAQRLHDLIGIDGLGEVIPCAALDRFDRGRDRGVAGQEKNAQFGLHIRGVRESARGRFPRRA